MDKFNWQQTFDSEHRFCSWSAPSQKQAQGQVNMPKHLICREYFGESFEFISSPLFAQKNHSLSTGKLKGNGAKCSCWTKWWPYEVSSHWIQRLVQGVTSPWASSDRATFCHRTPVVSMDASLHEPGSLLPWILAVESISSFCRSAGARHREVLIAIWCLCKAPSASCNSKYVVVTYLSLSNRWKLYSMILSYYFGALFLFPTLSFLVTWLQQFLDHKLRIRLAFYPLLPFSAPVLSSTINQQFSSNFSILILWLI